MFIDEVRITVKAGDGGSGCVAFHREKFAPRGGPSGGDGGKGGDVVLLAGQAASLRAYRNRRILKAESGRPGQSGGKHGRKGKGIVLEIPVGTVVKDAATGEVLVDLTREGARVVIAKGGKGGLGNKHFATPTNRAPRTFQKGEAGEHHELVLELKLMADVGLVGLPNAGKSTLLRKLTRARPKVADYPFTTLAPYLGIVELGRRDGDSGGEDLVLADLPGLIEGAHQGVGLGDRFLRHIERTRVVLHMVDLAPPDGVDPLEAVRVVERELESYGHGLAEKPRLVAGNKIDLTGADEAAARLESELGCKVWPISGLSGQGLPELLGALKKLVARQKRAVGSSS